MTQVAFYNQQADKRQSLYKDDKPKVRFFYDPDRCITTGKGFYVAPPNLQELKNPCVARRLVDHKTGTIYETVKEASHKTKLTTEAIYAHCCGKVVNPRFAYEGEQLKSNSESKKLVGKYKILHVPTGVIFDSCYQARKVLGIGESTIKRHLKLKNGEWRKLS